MDGQPLSGGRSTSGVIRIGDTVRRPIMREPAFGHACLLHLESIGFRHAPRFQGIDDAGREVLSFIPGIVPSDLGTYSDDQLAAAANLLRRFHNATADMPAIQAGGFEVACHNDWAPTNTVFVDDMPAAMIDFDTAQPGERLWDLGYSAFTWLDLGNDDHAPDEQVRRLGVFAAAYGHAECTVSRIAAYALARQTMLAASTRARGKIEIAKWAASCGDWTALNIVERLMPTGYSRSSV
ncbi:phosphotransferase [uncultured Sphingomonas sp.]|uniref:phosphotransferase n=1 Tax=uncultured Sphingomonas sp. TaxID=158754 RepID=UPI0025DF2339|nr:phosphotransferase [uncultured Sphingomonas sp.]